MPPSLDRDKPFKIIKADNDTVILNGDVTEKLNELPDNFFSLIISSPPYNIGKAYEKKIP